MRSPRPLNFSRRRIPTKHIPSQSHFGTHPSLIPERIPSLFSSTYGNPFCNPLCFQIHPGMGGIPSPAKSSLLPATLPVLYFHTLTNCKFLNSFLLIFMQIGGGCTPCKARKRAMTLEEALVEVWREALANRRSPPHGPAQPGTAVPPKLKRGSRHGGCPYLYSSAVARTPTPLPPITSTCPSVSRVAV
jgi:hypothetical protein